MTADKNLADPGRNVNDQTEEKKGAELFLTWCYGPILHATNYLKYRIEVTFGVK